MESKTGDGIKEREQTSIGMERRWRRPSTSAMPMEGASPETKLDSERAELWGAENNRPGAGGDHVKLTPFGAEAVGIVGNVEVNVAEEGDATGNAIGKSRAVKTLKNRRTGKAGEEIGGDKTRVTARVIKDVGEGGTVNPCAGGTDEAVVESEELPRGRGHPAKRWKRGEKGHSGERHGTNPAGKVQTHYQKNEDFLLGLNFFGD